MVEISVVMPCYNAAAYLERGLASALGQSFDSFEVVAVDDGSTDRTLEILNGWDDGRLVVVSQPNCGVSSARNRAMERARGQYVAFLDADDTWRPDCLERLHAALASHPEALLAYCGWQNVGLAGSRGEPYVPPDYEVVPKWEYLLRACPWPIHAALTKLSCVRSVGGFDERLRTSEDYRLWLEICVSGRVVRVPEVMAFYHFHDGPQATKAKADAAKRSLQVKQAFLARHSEIAVGLGRNQVRKLLYGTLLKRGFECYWARDLVNARPIFLYLLRRGYGRPADWIYMLPSLLPMRLHKTIVGKKDGRLGRAPQ